jgi:hypothetical protein
MPAAATSYRERRSDLSSVKFRGQVTIDSIRRDLQLILAHSLPDEDSDPFENLVLPLKVLLVELFEADGESHERAGYEDLYLFTNDGDFMSHLYRRFTRDRAGVDHYNAANFTPDADISKLFRYGETVRDMIGTRRLDYPLQNHPTVGKLRTHTLWK